MCGGDRDAEAGRASRDSRVTDRGNKNSALAQRVGEGDGFGRIADEPRHDEALRRGEIHTGGVGRALKVMREFPGATAALPALRRLNESHASRRGGGSGGRRGGGKEAWPRAVGRVIDQRSRTANVIPG